MKSEPSMALALRSMFGSPTHSVLQDSHAEPEHTAFRAVLWREWISTRIQAEATGTSIAFATAS